MVAVQQPPKVGQQVAFYPDENDPGRNLSSAVVATVVKLHEDGSLDLNVEGVVLEQVERLPAGEHATPHTWAP